MTVHYKDGSIADFPTTDHAIMYGSDSDYTALVTTTNVLVVIVPTQAVEYILA